MAVVVESVSSAAIGGSSGTSIVITKPTGLAVGDLMIAFVGGPNDYSVNTATNWTGLTQGQSIEGNQMTMKAQWKIADSSDVAAANFTFTVNTGSGLTGSILRISGHDSTTPIGAQNCTNNDSNGTTIAIACGITPTVANSLIIAAVWAGETGTVTVDSYALGTSSPAFTEHVDSVGTVAGTGRTMTMAIASGTRPEITATGNLTVTYSSSEARQVGALIAVSPGSAATGAKLLTLLGVGT